MPAEALKGPQHQDRCERCPEDPPCTALARRKCSLICPGCVKVALPPSLAQFKTLSAVKPKSSSASWSAAAARPPAPQWNHLHLPLIARIMEGDECHHHHFILRVAGGRGEGAMRPLELRNFYVIHPHWSRGRSGNWWGWGRGRENNMEKPRCFCCFSTFGRSSGSCPWSS